MRSLCVLCGAVGVVLLLAASANAQVIRVLGLDVSAHQGDISQTTWNNFAGVENRDFVFIRASRGGTTGEDHRAGGYPAGNNTFFNLSQRYDDLYFAQNITRATAAGMFAGSYHRSRADVIATTTSSGGVANNGTDEANHMIQMAGAWMRPGYLMPVLDFEDGAGVRTDAEMTQFALDFGNRVYAAMGIRPAIYINGTYAQNVLAGGTTAQRNQLSQQASIPPGLATSPTFPTLWSARWPAGPGAPYLGDVQNENPKDTYSNIYGPWDDYGVQHPWSFWQYSSGGRLQSFNNGGQDIDFNIANGGIEFLKDKLVPAIWMNDTSGDWATLANWNSGQTPAAPVVAPGQLARVGPLTLPTPRLPGAAGSGVTSGQHDTVILERANASITVTHSTGTTNIHKLYAREALNITGGDLTINYVPSSDSTPISAQFSAAVSLSGGALSVHTLQVDATRTLTVSGGNLTFNTINLSPAVVPGKLLVTGDLNVSPLANATATIANGVGAGTSGRLELGGANREINVANGAAEVDLSISVPVANGGLTKAGAGTLALSGLNTYAGDTTVEAGSLRLTGTNLANTADMFLSTGALLDLTFGAGTPDEIDSLFIDGVSQQAGVWGAVGSGAQFTSPLITGTGRLQVTTFVAPLAGDFDGNGTVEAADLIAWQNGYGMPTGAGAEHGDGDADGDVDGSDFLVWQRNLGQTNGLGASVGNAAAVPEPGSVVLALVAICGLLGRRAPPPRRG